MKYIFKFLFWVNGLVYEEDDLKTVVYEDGGSLTYKNAYAYYKNQKREDGIIGAICINNEREFKDRWRFLMTSLKFKSKIKN